MKHIFLTTNLIHSTAARLLLAVWLPPEVTNVRLTVRAGLNEQEALSKSLLCALLLFNPPAYI